MTGKEILLKTLRCEAAPRPAWVPFVGVHGGKLIGVAAGDYLRSADHIVEGQRRAVELYAPDGIPVVFDLQMEAEVLGCPLLWSDDVPPSVVSHPLADAGEWGDLAPFDLSKGRYPIVSQAARRLNDELGGTVALYGLITGPLTLLSHLRGSEMFMDMLVDPDKVEAGMAHCTRIVKTAADFYLDHGMPVIAVVDPMTSQIGTEHFELFVAPHISDIFDHIRGHHALSSLFVCGDATRNLEAMCQTHCDNVCIDENIPLEIARELAGKHGKSFGGNLRLTSVLLLGTESDCKLNAIDCMDKGGDRGFVLAPGCDLPYGTPEANIEAVATVVHDAYQRDVARFAAAASAADSFHDIVLPDYANEPEVIVDCITLDSAACAPCQYSVEAARKAAEKARVRVRVSEHKIKSREGIGMMYRLHVDKIPTICIDGQPTFVSIIPDLDTLVAAIERRNREKNGS